jgi:hypothetical protein
MAKNPQRMKLIARVLVPCYEEYYSGSISLYKDDSGRYGYLPFGCMSCGDAGFNDVSSIEECETLHAEALNEVIWLATKADAIAFLTHSDWRKRIKSKPYVEENPEVLDNFYELAIEALDREK